MRMWEESGRDYILELGGVYASGVMRTQNTSGGVSEEWHFLAQWAEGTSQDTRSQGF